MKFLISLAVFGIVAVLAGCGSAPAANSNTANANITNSRVQNVNASDLPPGLSSSPVAPVNDSAQTVPATANAANSSSKATAPDANAAGKPIKPGTTPTPGIPDPATLKKQMEEIKKRLNSNSNQQQPPPPPPGAGDGQMMRKKPRMSNSNN